MAASKYHRNSLPMIETGNTSMCATIAESAVFSSNDTVSSEINNTFTFTSSVRTDKKPHHYRRCHNVDQFYTNNNYDDDVNTIVAVNASLADKKVEAFSSFLTATTETPSSFSGGATDDNESCELDLKTTSSKLTVLGRNQHCLPPFFPLDRIQTNQFVLISTPATSSTAAATATAVYAVASQNTKNLHRATYVENCYSNSSGYELSEEILSFQSSSSSRRSTSHCDQEVYSIENNYRQRDSVMMNDLLVDFSTTDNAHPHDSPVDTGSIISGFGGKSDFPMCLEPMRESTDSGNYADGTATTSTTENDNLSHSLFSLDDHDNASSFRTGSLSSDASDMEDCNSSSSGKKLLS